MFKAETMVRKNLQSLKSANFYLYTILPCVLHHWFQPLNSRNLPDQRGSADAREIMGS